MTAALRGEVDVIQSFLATSLGDAIHLAAITPDGPCAFRWFGGDAASAATWAIQNNDAGRNLYWTVNRVREGLSTKPGKADVRAARFVHVDVDPPTDGSAWSPAPVLAEMTALASPPSFVIASGGGLQAFWRLEEESINLAAIEAINRGIRDRFEGDPCQNIDRLMRVPGTVNYPDQRKRARGRVPAPASLVYEDDGTVHDPIALAHRFPAREEAAPSAAMPTAPSTRAPLLTADDLGLAERDPIRATIDHPPADGSRAALACAGDMIRAGYSDEQVEGVLLNPANPVSRHCLDETNPVRAAWRCIAKARAAEDKRQAEIEHGGRMAEQLGFNATPQGTSSLDLEDVGGWHGLDVAPRRWLVEGWLPEGEAALITGAGAVGKSLVAQQLATCVAAGIPFLGVDVQQAAAVYVTCEDPRDELQRRQTSIAAAIGVPLHQIGGMLKVASWRGHLDNELASFDRERRMKPTARYQQLRETVLALGARLLVLDNTAHLFGGDENVKREVAAFCNLLNGLAGEMGGVVLLLGHPNKAGTNDGTTRGNQYGGSVGWENHVRSRMFMSADAEDHDARDLTNPKANYSAKGGKLRFRWHDGAFVRPNDLPGDTGAALAAQLLSAADDTSFLACLAERTRQQRAVSEAKASRTYAPKEFAGMPEAEGATPARLEAAMDRLFRANQIERGFLWNAHRKPVEGLRRAEGRRGDLCGDLCGDLAATPCGDVRSQGAATFGDTHLPLKGEVGAPNGAAASSDHDHEADEEAVKCAE